MLKIVRNVVLTVLGAAALLVAGVLLYLTIRGYKPEELEELPVTRSGATDALTDAGGELPLRVLSWNIGYGGLGENADFFMNGGSSVKSSDEPTVKRNLESIAAYIADLDPDYTLLQEVDIDPATLPATRAALAVPAAYPSSAESNG